MSEVIRVVAVRVNTIELTMYKADATMITIAQGDPRIKALVEKAVPEIEAHGFVDISLEDLKVRSHYAETEEKTGGVVRFFRALKSKVAQIVHTFSGTEENIAAGVIPEAKPSVQTTEAPKPATEEEMVKRSEEVPLTKSQAAVNEIMANAVSTSDSTFHTGVPQDTTVVAVMADGTIIPGMEKLSKQMEATAAGVNSGEGMANFLNRLAQVKRAHSAQDLLTFMEKGELPIADDGTALVYKRLQSTSEDGVFVDCHTRTVRQSVGSLVFMNESLVDHNRSTECSNGLHVARRDYLHSFSGDVMVLAKLAPEDVIAVPHGDARKLRARAYHIIALLSKEDAQAAIRNEPISNTQLLGNAVAGKHIGVTNLVEILNQRKEAGSIKYTNVEGADYVQEESGRVATSLDHVETESAQATSVDARELALKEVPKYTAEEVAEAVKPVVEAAVEKAVVKATGLQAMKDAYQSATTPEALRDASQALLNHKAKVKKSWTALGIGAAQVEKMKEAAQYVAPVVSKPVAKKPVTKPSVAKPVATKTATAKASPLKDKKVSADRVSLPEQALHLMFKVIDGDKKAAKDLLALKKSSKKSWDYLGINEPQVAQIKKLAE